MRTVLLVSFATALVACSGADTSDDDDSDDAPVSCTPDEDFCRGSQLRTCTASGADSVVKWDCDDSGPGAECVACSGASSFACEGDAITGSLSFAGWNKPYRFPGGCADPLLQATAGINALDGLSVMVTFGAYQYVHFAMRQAGSYDGPLFEPINWDDAHATMDVLAPTSDGAACVNTLAAAAGTFPPSAGHIHVELDGTEIGATFSITAEGYLWCVINGAIVWRPVSLSAEGVLTSG